MFTRLLSPSDCRLGLKVYDEKPDCERRQVFSRFGVFYRVLKVAQNDASGKWSVHFLPWPWGN